MREVMDKMNLREITICYGLTETSPVFTQTSADDDIEHKCETVGRKHPPVDVRVIDPTDGHICAIGEPGELCCKGYNVMKGYWHREEETKKVLEPDGWLHTGDLAYMDEDRFIYIVDRLKDLIIVNGENIYPGEVEDCIYEVEGVSECAVIGHPDPLRGQVVWAYVVMKEGYDFDENRIRKYLSRNLASYKIPRRFIPMDALPKNASGKILKRALRDK